MIECEFNEIPGQWEYTCIVKNFQPSDDSSITHVQGQHDSNKSNDDVKQFLWSGNRNENLKVLKTFPKNVKKLFKNVEIIWIEHTNLEEISNEDLKEFGENLKVLGLTFNKIKKIDENLFKFNLNLEEISLQGNQIEKIKPKTFDGLGKLKILNLNKNPCLNDEDFIFNEKNEVEKLIKKIKEGKLN